MISYFVFSQDALLLKQWLNMSRITVSSDVQIKVVFFGPNDSSEDITHFSRAKNVDICQVINEQAALSKASALLNSIGASSHIVIGTDEYTPVNDWKHKLSEVQKELPDVVAVMGRRYTASIAARTMLDSSPLGFRYDDEMPSLIAANVDNFCRRLPLHSISVSNLVVGWIGFVASEQETLASAFDCAESLENFAELYSDTFSAVADGIVVYTPTIEVIKTSLLR